MIGNNEGVFLLKKLFFGAVIGASLLLGACGSDDDAKKDGSTSAEPDAAALAEQKCMGCHGKNLEGSSAPALTKVGAEKSEEEIHDILINGTKGGMPSGLVNEEEADQLAKWLSEKK